jgi:hypothetical protein
MEKQPPRINWFRLATRARQAEADSQPQSEPIQQAQAPPATATRQPTLPVVRAPVVPLPVMQPRPTAPSVTQPTSQPVMQQPVVVLPPVQPTQPVRRPPTPPQVQPAQPGRRPVTPPQQDIPKSAVPTSNGVSKPISAPSPPPSPKVIKTSTPTPPPSPRVTLQAQIPLISVSKTTDPEAETQLPLVQFQLKSIAIQEDGVNKANGNGVGYNNANTTISNGGNGKNSSSDSNQGNMNHAPHPKKKEIENGQERFESRAKPPHFSSGMAMSNSGHKKSQKDMKVITLAGENIGALMELGHNVHGYDKKMHHGGTNLTSKSPAQDGKASQSMDNKSTTRSKPMTSLVNSNVHSINNSLLFNSSCTQRSPGVYVTYKSNSKGKAHKTSHGSTSSLERSRK